MKPSLEFFSDFPNPPIPREYRNKFQLWFPEGVDDFIDKQCDEARNLFTRGEITQAKNLLNKIVRIDPFKGEIWRSLGDIYFDEGSYVHAFNCYHGYLFHRSEAPEGNHFWVKFAKVYAKI